MQRLRLVIMVWVATQTVRNWREYREANLPPLSLDQAWKSARGPGNRFNDPNHYACLNPTRVHDGDDAVPITGCFVQTDSAERLLEPADLRLNPTAVWLALAQLAVLVLVALGPVVRPDAEEWIAVAGTAAAVTLTHQAG